MMMHCRVHLSFKNWKVSHTYLRLTTARLLQHGGFKPPCGQASSSNRNSSLFTKNFAHMKQQQTESTQKTIIHPSFKIAKKKKTSPKKHTFSVSFCHQKKGLLKDLSFPHQTELLFKQRAHGMLVHKAGKEKGWWWRSMVGLWLGMGVWHDDWKLFVHGPPVCWIQTFGFFFEASTSQQHFMLNNRFLQSDMIARCKKQLKIIASLSSKESKKKKKTSFFDTLQSAWGRWKIIECISFVAIFWAFFECPRKQLWEKRPQKKKRCPWFHVVSRVSPQVLCALTQKQNQRLD